MLIFLVFLVLSQVHTASYNLKIFHTNDIHARYDQRGGTEGGKCKIKEKGDQCYGGMPRHATFFKDNVKEGENSLILSAGDWFTGTTYFHVYQGNLSAEYMNQLKYTALALGNHEFDRGPVVLGKMLDKLTSTKVLVANVDVSAEPVLAGKVQASEIVTVGGRKIGIIGYITPDTKFLSSPGDKVEFFDVVDAVKKEAERLTEEDGVNIIVAVGHAGIKTDENICKFVPDVDVVVGGHTNTFLYNGGQESVNEKIEGPYPKTFTTAGSGDCLVVQAYAYGKYMGNLSVDFNDAGEVASYSGNPVLLDDSVAQDPDTLTALGTFSEEVEKYRNITVGNTNKEVDGVRTNCRQRECQLGNILADAWLDAFRKHDDSVVCALVNSGSIRASIDEGTITFEDIVTVLPFGNTVDRFTAKGSVLRASLEHGVSEFTKLDNEEGRYLQVAGLNITYNTMNPVGSRVKDLRIADSNGDYSPVDDETLYTCVAPNYVLAGGDGFEMLKDLQSVSGSPDVDVFIDFVEANSPLDQYPGIQKLPSRSFFSLSGAGGVKIVVTLLVMEVVMLML